MVGIVNCHGKDKSYIRAFCYIWMAQYCLMVLDPNGGCCDYQVLCKLPYTGVGIKFTSGTTSLNANLWLTSWKNCSPFTVMFRMDASIQFSVLPNESVCHWINMQTMITYCVYMPFFINWCMSSQWRCSLMCFKTHKFGDWDYCTPILIIRLKPTLLDDHDFQFLLNSFFSYFFLSHI